MAVDSQVTPATSGRVWSPARGYFIILLLPVLFLLLFFLWPLVTVIGRSFGEDGTTVVHFLTVFERSSYLKVLGYTFQVAATVTVLCLLIAYPVAALIARLRGGWLQISFALILVPFWTSTVIRTYAWMVLFQRKGVINGFLTDLGLVDAPLRFMHNNVGVHIGMVHIMLPFMLLPLISAFRNIDPSFMRAAGVLGANPIRSFWHVYLPLSMPGVSAGVALVFITSLGFYITPALLGGAQNMMVAVLIEQQVSITVNWELASALATLLLLLTAGLYIVYDRVARRAGAGGVLE
jgi:putative spermidine/putrescine transport system permease protein/mannopine transport system permease protein